MTTMVFDPATTSAALEERLRLSRAGMLGALTPEQRRLKVWHLLNTEYVQQLNDLYTKVSADHQELNGFLVEGGFNPLFRRISNGGIGVAAIIDMLLKWTQAGTPSEIRRPDGGYRAFDLSDVELLLKSGHDNTPLVRITAADGKSAWLIMLDEPPADQIHLAEIASKLLAAPHSFCRDYAGVRIPTVEIDQQVELDWLKGMEVGGQDIDQAFQQVKIRMNEHGARAKAATGLATRGLAPKRLVFDRPFLLFFTQAPNLSVRSPKAVPICCAWVDVDSWREPAGSLTEM